MQGEMAYDGVVCTRKKPQFGILGPSPKGLESIDRVCVRFKLNVRLERYGFSALPLKISTGGLGVCVPSCCCSRPEGDI